MTWNLDPPSLILSCLRYWNYSRSTDDVCLIIKYLILLIWGSGILESGWQQIRIFRGIWTSSHERKQSLDCVRKRIVLFVRTSMILSHSSHPSKTPAQMPSHVRVMFQDGKWQGRASICSVTARLSIGWWILSGTDILPFPWALDIHVGQLMVSGS